MWAIPTAAVIDFIVANTATFNDALQIGTLGDVSWSFTGQNFKMEVKASRADAAGLVTWSTGAGTIVVDDAVQRILHFNVPDTAIQAALPVGEYVYDLVMYDGSVPPIRNILAQGKLFVTQGVTES